MRLLNLFAVGVICLFDVTGLRESVCWLGWWLDAVAVVFEFACGCFCVFCLFWVLANSVVCIGIFICKQLLLIVIGITFVLFVEFDGLC